MDGSSFVLEKKGEKYRSDADRLMYLVRRTCDFSFNSVFVIEEAELSAHKKLSKFISMSRSSGL